MRRSAQHYDDFARIDCKLAKLCENTPLRAAYWELEVQDCDESGDGRHKVKLVVYAQKRKHMQQRRTATTGAKQENKQKQVAAVRKVAGERIASRHEANDSAQPPVGRIASNCA